VGLISKLANFGRGCRTAVEWERQETEKGRRRSYLRRERPRPKNANDAHKRMEPAQQENYNINNIYLRDKDSSSKCKDKTIQFSSATIDECVFLASGSILIIGVEGHDVLRLISTNK
jgi:hypothetical protein